MADDEKNEHDQLNFDGYLECNESVSHVELLLTLFSWRIIDNFVEICVRFELPIVWLISSSCASTLVIFLYRTGIHIIVLLLENWMTFCHFMVSLRNINKPHMNSISAEILVLESHLFFVLRVKEMKRHTIYLSKLHI